MKTTVRDPHSYSNPHQVRVRKAALDLEVRFAEKALAGYVTLEFERSPDAAGAPLILDTRDLAIASAEAAGPDGNWQPVQFELGPRDPVLGSALKLTTGLEDRHTQARIQYRTSPSASGLQWLEPAQTEGRKHPFLFSQSQAIHARSWIPLQDSPGVRITYSARIRTPKELLALMSAENDPQAARTGEYQFRMDQPIPSYLMALAVGDLAFQPMSARTGVYAEPAMVARAAKEFEDTEKMMQAAEKLFGPYRWGRYDLLVLPPSFPYGGMENPRLTFATPTVIAGDKSLVSLIAHELAHSWSGNLVTNATWGDFWLNEGFTVYLEWRIQEEVFGKARQQMDASLEVGELKRELARLETRDQLLEMDVNGRDPDAIEGQGTVPYVKGALLLLQLEHEYGREKFDPVLRGYFDRFAFQSLVTADFVAYLKEKLPDSKIPLEKWLRQPGLPENAFLPKSDAFEAVGAAAKGWLEGRTSVDTKGWTTQQWLHFLRAMPVSELTPAKMAALDNQFAFTRSGNSEIVFEWLQRSIQTGYTPAYPKLEQFLTTVGRRKFVKPLYEELVKSPEGKTRAETIYSKARAGYHPITQAAADRIVK